MQMKTYDIIYILNEERKVFQCSIYSLQKYIDKFVEEGGQVLCIVEHKPKERTKKLKNPDKVAKNRYYNTKYTSYYKMYKSNKIKEEEFKEVVKILKQLKAESSTKEEFETKFLTIKNTNNIRIIYVSEYNYLVFNK